MNHFLKHTVYFLAFALIGYCFLLCIWGAVAPASFKPNLNYKIGTYGHMYSRLKDLETVKDVDVLFLGSSHVYRGLDTRIFEAHGYRSFNLGSSAQTPLQTELLLRRYLDVLQPKLVLYDIYPESFDSDGVESALDIISNSTNDLETVTMALKINHIKVYNTLIYGFYRDLFGLNTDFKEAIKKGEDTYIKNGFVEKQLRYNHTTYTGEISWTLEAQQAKAFHNIISLFKSKAIPYALIQIPVTSSRYQAYQNKAEFTDFLKGKGDYYNFNELLRLNDSLDFYDTQHLNTNGVAVFDSLLISTLLKKE